jgi:hypothetical protein
MFVQSTKTSVGPSRKSILQNFSWKEYGILVLAGMVGVLGGLPSAWGVMEKTAALSKVSVQVLAVGIPVIARTRFPEGAAAFGLIMSLFGGGALVGTILAGVLPKPSKKLLGTVSLSVISMMGIGLAVIGFAPTVYIATAGGLVMGKANGYANTMLVTWLQPKVAPEMTGRVMSLVMFAAIGLNPVSTALAG